MQSLNLDKISEQEFNVIFNSEENCLEFLSQKKWSNGFTCKKCGNTNFCEGKSPFSHRCTRCKHDESARVDTIFEGCRFDLTKAFYIAYIVCHMSSDSSHELSRKLSLRQMTCWSFKKKLMDCLQKRKDSNLINVVTLEDIVLQK